MHRFIYLFILLIVLNYDITFEDFSQALTHSWYDIRASLYLHKRSKTNQRKEIPNLNPIIKRKDHQLLQQLLHKAGQVIAEHANGFVRGNKWL